MPATPLPDLFPSRSICASYHLVGKIDSDNQVAEDNQTDNTFVGPQPFELLDDQRRLHVEGTDAADVITIGIGAGYGYTVQKGKDFACRCDPAVLGACATERP